MIQNLPENWFYEKIPLGVLSLDELGLIRAVIGGYQAHVEDLRSYTRKLHRMFETSGLPEVGPNVVLADLLTPDGTLYTRSLDILPDTPPEGTDQLGFWTANQLRLPTNQVANVRYGTDLLRLVDVDTRDFLAATIGAVIYQSAALHPDEMDAVKTRILSTYFPRLKIKGTAKSFEALARTLGFSDVSVTPLFGRLSAHLPNDVGAPINEGDFSADPDYVPQQFLGPLYDPHETNDGPFYEWSGTASDHLAASDFYTQVVNGFQPFFKVVVLNSFAGTVTAPDAGVYEMAGGGPHIKAHVDAAGVRFQALAEGDDFNGLKVNVTVNANGSRVLAVLDRMSAIKYRSSYYDLSLGLSFDEPGNPDALQAPNSRAEEVFGTSAIDSNPDLRADPNLTPDGTAKSPFRPWYDGIVPAGFEQDGFLVRSALVPMVTNGTDKFNARFQAAGTVRQYNVGGIMDAGVQVASALEEVRPATRQPLRTGVGFSTEDEVGYAKYASVSALNGSGSIALSVLEGYATGHPLPPYQVEFTIVNGNSTQTLLHETYPYDANILLVRGVAASGTLFGVEMSGTYNYLDHHFRFTFPPPGLPPGSQVIAHWTPSATETVRLEPAEELTVIGIVGDPHQNNAGERAVAAMVLGWNPHAIMIVGDSALPTAAQNIQDTMAPFVGYRDAGKLFSAIGNHDYSPNTAGTSLLEYFAFYNNLPGNGRYYSKRVGDVEMFVYNLGWNSNLALPLNQTATLEPDGISEFSIQATFIKNAMQNSTARWKIVFIHFEPYGSFVVNTTRYPGYSAARLPWKQWGADIVFSGHIHAYERVIVDGVQYITCGWSGHPQLRQYEPVGPIIGGSVVRFPVEPQPVEYGGVRLSATPTMLMVEARTVGGRLVDSLMLTKAAPVAEEGEYQERPEDDIELVEMTASGSNVFSQLDVADDYPWRRAIVGGGEDVDADIYVTTKEDEGTQLVSLATSVPDQTGVEHNVGVIASPATGHPRVVFQQRPYDASYEPGQPSIGYTGIIKDVATYNEDELAWHNTQTDFETAFSPGFGIYHIGLVNGVLVADPQTFNRPVHRDGLTGWIPFNEHAEDDLKPVDRVLANADIDITGLRPEYRHWDENFGWHLAVMPGTRITVDASRSAEDDFSMSVWLARLSTSGTLTSTIFEYAGVSLDSDGSSVLCYVRDLDDNRQLVGSYQLLETLRQFTLRKTKTKAYFGQGDLKTETVETGWFGESASFADDATLLTVRGGQQSFLIRDLRIWNRFKTQEEMNIVRCHVPSQVVANYRIGIYRSLNRGDRVAMRVLPCGFATPALLPPYIREPSLKRIQRYDSMARYKGESRFHEVGLGGGRSPENLAVPVRLGNQFLNLTADGTTVAGSNLGNMPGVNAAWLNDQPPGKFVTVYSGTFVPKESDWKYLDDGSDRLTGTPYYSTAYDDGTWKTGNGYFGYGDVDERTTLSFGPNPAAKYITTYFRKKFEVKDASLVGPLQLLVRRDDGAVVYINGAEVARFNMAAGAYTYLTPANVTVSNDPAYYPVTVPASVLVNGVNLIAVDLHQRNATSSDTAFDAMLAVLNSGSGGVAGVLSTAAGTWPQAMPETNPNRHEAWVKGEDGYVYEIRLNGNGPVTSLVAERIVRGYSQAEIDFYGTSYGTRYVEQPTGAEVMLAGNGKILAVAHGGTAVYQKGWGGILQTPPLFMYLNSRVVEDAPNAYDRWNEAGNTSFYGERQTPPVAARDTNGLLEFIGNFSTLNPGYYELTVESGNLGTPDGDFDGFDVDITVDSVTGQRRLLAGKKGHNVRGVDTFEFYFPEAVTTEWVLAFNWKNAFADPTRQQFRRLAIFSYSLRKIETELWRVGIGPSQLSFTQLNTVAYSQATPGGWLVALNSYGTAVQHRHEAKVYPASDTVSSKQPLSALLTASTNLRREDLLFTANGTQPDFIPSEPASLTLPFFGTLSEAPVVPPVFLWAGGYQPELQSAVVVVKMAGQTSAVRLAYAPASQWPGGAKFTDFSTANVENNNVARFTLEDLQPHTRYYYAAANGVQVDYNLVGTLTTWGTQPFNFRFVVTACVQNEAGVAQNGPVFNVIRTGNPLFLMNIGDFHYNNPITEAQFNTAAELPFTAPLQAALLRSCLTDWTWDDHDYGQNDGNASHPGRSEAWKYYRRYAPHYPLPAGDAAPIYHAFTVGNCRFICTDSRSAAHPIAYLGADKSMLGREQREWLKAELLRAKGRYGLIFWVSTNPWISSSTTDDDWGSYTAERAEIAQFVYDNDIKGIFILSGDMHANALDDGRNSKYARTAPDPDTPYVTTSGSAVGGLPVFHCAPLHQTASRKGGPYWKGPDPASGSAVTERFGIVTVTIDGAQTYVTFSARTNTGAQVANMLHTFNGTESPNNL